MSHAHPGRHLYVLEAGYAMIPCPIMLKAHTPDYYRYAIW